MKFECQKMYSTVLFVIFALFVFLVTSKPLEDSSNNGYGDENRYTEINQANSTSSIKPPLRICEGNTPCGWAAYNKTSMLRKIEYFMKNTCECPNHIRCLSDEDDISLAAYVYRCKTEENAKS